MIFGLVAFGKADRLKDFDPLYPIVRRKNGYFPVSSKSLYRSDGNICGHVYQTFTLNTSNLSLGTVSSTS